MKSYTSRDAVDSVSELRNCIAEMNRLATELSMFSSASDVMTKSVDDELRLFYRASEYIPVLVKSVGDISDRLAGARVFVIERREEIKKAIELIGIEKNTVDAFETICKAYVSGVDGVVASDVASAYEAVKRLGVSSSSMKSMTDMMNEALTNR